jgi:hypothetical protein
VGECEFYGLGAGFWLFVGGFGHLDYIFVGYWMLRSWEELQMGVEVGIFLLYLNSG